MKHSITNWFKNISIKKKLYYIAGIMFVLITVELVTLCSIVYLLSATRAYVGGEGLWSKAQKDATIDLMKYAHSHDEKDYQNYLTFLNVILGDKKARFAMQEPHPDLKMAYQGFLEGLNQPIDIPRMINLFLWFQHVYYLQKAISIWTDADTHYIPTFISIGENLHREILTGNFTTAEQNKFKVQIYQINTKLTELENNFSYALADASRWLENIVLRAILSIAIIVEISGLLLTIFVTFNIRKGIYEVIRVSKKIKLMDFSDRATRYSDDEIGQLAGSFNRMIDDLAISILKQNDEIAEREQQGNLLAVRYAITHILVENSSLDKAIPKILEILCERLQFEYGGFWKVDNVENMARCTKVWSTNDIRIKEFNEFSQQLILRTGQVLPGKAWESKKLHWIQDIAKESPIARLKLANKAGLRGAFAVPILFDGDVLGILEFFTRHVYPLDNNLLQVFNDISNLLGIYIEREHAQNRVAELSRLTGMAEVASNVLHNVGNTLNSINTSITLMKNKSTYSKMDNLVEIDKLLQQHNADLQNFLVNDPRGQKIPQFISLLANEWLNEKKFITDEINSLMKNVSQIKNIIMMQQSLSHAVDITEEIGLYKLLDDAIALNKLAYEQARVEIIRDFKPVQPIIIDKVKLFQIIVNLVKNGIDALVESNKVVKKLILRLEEKDDSDFMIKVSDNGIGIAPENITKIFRHGFTTKKSGHGFGLHNSALYAEALGGTLSAESNGIDDGATFTLILPYKPILKKGRRS